MPYPDGTCTRWIAPASPGAPKECLFAGINLPGNDHCLFVDKPSPLEEAGHTFRRIRNAKRFFHIPADCFNAVIGMLTQMVLQASYVNLRQKPDTVVIMGL